MGRLIGGKTVYIKIIYFNNEDKGEDGRGEEIFFWFVFILIIYIFINIINNYKYLNKITFIKLKLFYLYKIYYY